MNAHAAEGMIDQKIDQWVPESELLDPENRRPAYRHLMQIVLIVAETLGLAAAWRWTPLGKWLNIDTVTKLYSSFRGGSGGNQC